MNIKSISNNSWLKEHYESVKISDDDLNMIHYLKPGTDLAFGFTSKGGSLDVIAAVAFKALQNYQSKFDEVEKTADEATRLKDKSADCEKLIKAPGLTPYSSNFLNSELSHVKNKCKSTSGHYILEKAKLERNMPQFLEALATGLEKAIAGKKTFDSKRPTIFKIIDFIRSFFGFSSSIDIASQMHSDLLSLVKNLKPTKIKVEKDTSVAPWVAEQGMFSIDLDKDPKYFFFEESQKKGWM